MTEPFYPTDWQKIAVAVSLFVLFVQKLAAEGRNKITILNGDFKNNSLNKFIK